MLRWRSLNRSEIVDTVEAEGLCGMKNYAFELVDGSRWVGFGYSARQAMLSVELLETPVVKEDCTECGGLGYVRYGYNRELVCDCREGVEK